MVDCSTAVQHRSKAQRLKCSSVGVGEPETRLSEVRLDCEHSAVQAPAIAVVRFGGCHNEQRGH